MITVKRFTAPWCAPCRMLAPVLSGLATQYPEVAFETIDVDLLPDVAEQHAIRSVPTVIFEKDGVSVQTFVGVQSKNVYIDVLNSLLGENDVARSL